MADDRPILDKAVIVLFEGIALALAFGGVEQLLAGKPLWRSLIIWILSFALSVFGFAWPRVKARISPFIASPKLAKNPVSWLLAGAIVGGVLWTQLAALTAYWRQPPAPASPVTPMTQLPTPCSCPTRARLQFDADGVSHNVEQQNIFHWFALWHTYTYKAASDNKMRTEKTLTLYLTFTQPVAIKEFRIDGGGMALPLYEVKDQTPRNAIVEFQGPIKNTVVSVEVVN